MQLKTPTTNLTKTQLQDWKQKEGIAFNRKKYLWILIIRLHQLPRFTNTCKYNLMNFYESSHVFKENQKTQMFVVSPYMFSYFLVALA